MAHRGGLRSIYNSTRRGYKDAGVFRVRYWSLTALQCTFEKNIGPTKLIAEAFGGLGLLTEDRVYVSALANFLISVSGLLKSLCRFLPALIWIADSVYVMSVKPSSQGME
jgi:hypothetical protein